MSKIWKIYPAKFCTHVHPSRNINEIPVHIPSTVRESNENQPELHLSFSSSFFNICFVLPDTIYASISKKYDILIFILYIHTCVYLLCRCLYISLGIMSSQISNQNIDQSTYIKCSKSFKIFAISSLLLTFGFKIWLIEWYSHNKYVLHLLEKSFAELGSNSDLDVSVMNLFNCTQLFQKSFKIRKCCSSKMGTYW